MFRTFRRLALSSLALLLTLSNVPDAAALTASRQPGGNQLLMNVMARTAARRAARARTVRQINQTPPISSALVAQRRRAVRLGQRSMRRLVPTASTATNAANTTVSVVDRQRAGAVFELTNKERVQAGLKPLRRNALLDLAAQRHATDLNVQNYFAHENTKGEKAGDRIKAAGYEYLTYGENIAKGQDSAVKVVKDWMESPGHKANIMLPEFDEIGIGIDGSSWVQNFAQSKVRFEAPAEAATALLDLLNAERSAGGVATLRFDEQLMEVAATIAPVMREKEAFVYEDAAGRSARDMLMANGYFEDRSVTLLQLAVSGSPTAERAANTFLSSTQNHRRITDANFHSVGIGVSGVYWLLILTDK